MRNGLNNYVNSESGAVEWQLMYVRSTGNDEYKVYLLINV